MKFRSSYFPLLAAVLPAFLILPSRAGQTSPGPQSSSPAATQPASSTPVAGAPAKPAAVDSKTPPVTEDSLRQRYAGKMVFVRGLYEGDNLEFNQEGKVNGSPASGSFTLSALEIRKVHLSKRKVEFEADRYALHFFGALPYENDTKSFDKVKISKRPVRISIERELVVIPKVKKVKTSKIAPPAKPGAAASPQAGGAPNPASQAAAAPAPAPMPESVAPGTTTSPAHSAMMLDRALDNVFALDIDQRMLASLPDYWQRYFQSKREHREFMPADTSIQAVGDGVTPPHVLNAIDPSSNQYAQKFGIAGLTLFRTVIDASGKPEDVAIARPIGFGLDESAVNAIKASRFTPAMKAGRPVPVVIDLVVTFRIYSNRTKPGSVPKGAKRAQVAASAWDEGVLNSH